MKLPDFKELSSSLSSIVPVLITPFDSNGEIDYPALKLLFGRLVSAGIKVLTVNGNTGEFYALSPTERSTLLEMTVEVVGTQALVISGVGFDIATAVASAKFAHAAGAHAVMIHQPPHPYQSSNGWTRYHREIAEAIPDMGIIPYIRDASVSGAMLEELVRTCPNVIGVKYAVPNPIQFAQTVEIVGAECIAWVCGLAESWAPFFWLGGARGFTSGLANVYAPLSFQMLTALQAGDFDKAMQVWRAIKPFEDLRARENNGNNIPVVKEAMAQLGLCGRAVRPPIGELSEPARVQVRDILMRWDLHPISA